MTITLSVNGDKVRVGEAYDPSARLIDVLRQETKYKVLHTCHM